LPETIMNPRTTLSLALLLGCAPALATSTAQVATLETEAVAVDRYATGNSAVVEGRIADTFTPFAGSPENASALVAGLRDGTPVNLMATAPDGSITITGFAPATGPMGYGNVRISMALAEQRLASLGVTNPTPEQLVAALNGGPISYVGPDGVVTATVMPGVLEQRAAGMGWGQIAQSQGSNLGPVISGLQTTRVAVHPLTTKPTGNRAATTRPAGAVPRGSNAKGAATGADKAGTSGTATTSQGKGHAYGKGIVTGYGAGPEGVAATHPGKGQAHGAGAKAPVTPISTPAGAAAAATTAGVSTGQGQGNGNAFGQGKAQGRN
jgi:hypothetical protein